MRITYNHYRPYDSLALEITMTYYEQYMRGLIICLTGTEREQNHRQTKANGEN